MQGYRGTGYHFCFRSDLNRFLLKAGYGASIMPLPLRSRPHGLVSRYSRINLSTNGLTGQPQSIAVEVIKIMY